MTTRGALTLCLTLFSLAQPLPSARGSDEAETVERAKEKARKSIEALIESSDWKRALKAIGTYRKKHVRTNEEKERCRLWCRFVKGSQALDAITDYHRRHQKGRKTAERLYRFLEEYGGDEKLRERAEGILQAVRPTEKLVLEDFEDALPGPTRGTVDLVSEDVREGRRAGIWRSKDREEDYFYIYFQHGDWTDWEYLCLWVRTDRPKGKISFMAMTEWNPSWPRHFYGFTNLAKRGWSLVRLPLRGEGSVFRRDGTADWSRIGTLALRKEGIELDSPVVLDAIWLERDRKP